MIFSKKQASRPKRATVEEVLDFANKVRAAGGANPIDALMPAIPRDESACLIAKNLNFNCEVFDGHDAEWGMHVEDRELAYKIGEALGLKVYWPPDSYEPCVIDLPARIGQVAADFDNVSGVLRYILGLVEQDFYEKYAHYPGESRLENVVFDDFYGRELDAAGTAFIEKRIRFYLRRTPKRLREDVRDLMPLVQLSSEEARRIAAYVNPDGSIVR